MKQKEDMNTETKQNIEETSKNIMDLQVEGTLKDREEHRSQAHCGAQPKQIDEPPPGGCDTRVDRRSVMTLPQF